jgi:hypothetical protein
MAYARGAKRFFDWCEDHDLKDIEPIAIAAHIEEQGQAEPIFTRDIRGEPTSKHTYAL